ncbi:hypothetical protein OG874_13395 [Nocardia sp. NBC_00565]|uniref:hypothetical protein n=1 Tax=Nocardia sp. NBC_00565 TaxID=2975993 RepID=UPI002E824112|nr:hypothetical protein [Nocardia sp. NBC_00565]WUC06064.1 hypothetical protein OG874_13395 [Nocardia sp. NBC_00565]
MRRTERNGSRIRPCKQEQGPQREAPRRDGAVYGEECRAADADAVVEAVALGKLIPRTPEY